MQIISSACVFSPPSVYGFIGILERKNIFMLVTIGLLPIAALLQWVEAAWSRMAYFLVIGFHAVGAMNYLGEQKMIIQSNG